MEALNNFRALVSSSEDHVLLIQETHLNNNSYINLPNFTTYISANPKNPTGSAGIGCFVKKGLKILQYKVHVPGRVASLWIEFQEEKFWFLNVYAPNDPAERRKLFMSLPKPPEATRIFMGGDFNCLHDERDKISVIDFEPDPSIHSLVEYAANNNLEDTFRELNPNTAGTTCASHRKTTKGMIWTLTRLDRWYCPKSMRLRLAVEVDFTGFPWKSDHSSVVLTVKPASTIERGRGYWIMNNSLLKDAAYKKGIENLIQASISNQEEARDMRSWWELLKFQCKEVAVARSVEIARLARDTKKEKARTLNQLIEAFKNIPADQDLASNIDLLKKEITNSEIEKAVGARIRSKVKWLDLGEKPTKYFYALEKARGADQTIKALKNKEGLEVNEPTELTEVAADFYQELYTPDTAPGREDAQERILDSWSKMITPAQREVLEKPMTEEELKQALSSMGKEKSPGLDGLTVEFYQTFWSDLAPQYLKVINEIFHERSLPSSQKYGIITLIFKKGEREDIKNWRPISLLNVDFKLISKVLTNRLAKVLPSILSPEQTAVKGRYIMDAVHTIQIITWHLKRSGSEGGILYLDQEKAFDRVDHNFLWKVLEKAGIPSSFIEMIQTLYRDSSSMVKINGFLSRSIRIKRGVRQGDPLSPLLFTLVIEALANYIRNHPDIKGIKIPGIDESIRISLYADDTAIPFSGLDELPAIKEALELYCEASDAKLNLKKCIGIYYNGTVPFGALGMTWMEPDSSISYLGIPIGNENGTINEWQRVHGDMIKTLAHWKRRNLSMQGRMLIIKSLILSKAQYLAAAARMDKKKVVDPIEQTISKFFWKDKRGKISMDTLSLPKKDGGINASTLSKYCSAVRIKILLRALTSDQPWAASVRWSIQRCIGTRIRDLNEILSATFPSHETDLSGFWQQTLKDWQEFRTKLDPQQPEITSKFILCQPLFCNENIIHPQEKKPLTKKRWLEMEKKGEGICFIVDLWDGDRFKTTQELRRRIVMQSPTRDRLVEAIPLAWRQHLNRHHPNNLEVPKRTLDLSSFAHKGNPLPNLTTKQIREALQQRPRHCPSFWAHMDISWRTVWRELMMIKDRTHRDTLYFLLNAALPMGERLTLWGKPAAKCGCGEIESFLHTFGSCAQLEGIWGESEKLIGKKLDLQERITGLIRMPRRSGRKRKQWRNLHALVIHTIWYERCRWVHGEKPRDIIYILRKAFAEMAGNQ